MFYFPIYKRKWMEFILHESTWNRHTDTVSSSCASRDTSAVGNNFTIYFGYLYVQTLTLHPVPERNSVQNRCLGVSETCP